MIQIEREKNSKQIKEIENLKKQSNFNKIY